VAPGTRACIDRTNGAGKSTRDKLRIGSLFGRQRLREAVRSRLTVEPAHSARPRRRRDWRERSRTSQLVPSLTVNRERHVGVRSQRSCTRFHRCSSPHSTRRGAPRAPTSCLRPSTSVTAEARPLPCRMAIANLPNSRGDGREPVVSGSTSQRGLKMRRRTRSPIDWHDSKRRHHIFWSSTHGVRHAGSTDQCADTARISLRHTEEVQRGSARRRSLPRDGSRCGQHTCAGGQ